MSKRIFSASAFAILIIIFAKYLWRESSPEFIGDFHSQVWSNFDGDSETYRELGGFSINHWKYRQWFKQHGLTTSSGCIVEDQPGTKVGIGGSKIGSDFTGSTSSVVETSFVGVISKDGRTVIPKIEVEIKYDLSSRKVTLLNTGEIFPLSDDRVFLVYVDKNFKISKFVCHDPNRSLVGIHPKLIKSFEELRHVLNKPAESRPGE